jgi:hypothetical protein
MVCMAARALPMRVGFGGRRSTERITLSEAAGFGLATLLFLDLGEKQAYTTLVHSLVLCDLDLMTGLAGQSSIECDSSQKYPAFGVGGIARCQAFGGLGARQLIRLQGEGERCEVGMRRAFPGIRDA